MTQPTSTAGGAPRVRPYRVRGVKCMCTLAALPMFSGGGTPDNDTYIREFEGLVGQQGHAITPTFWTNVGEAGPAGLGGGSDDNKAITWLKTNSHLK